MATVGTTASPKTTAPIGKPAIDAPEMNGADNGARKSEIIGWALAAFIAIGLFAATHVYWLPSAGGVDQNGYLLGGLTLVQHHNGIITLPNPFIDLGPHWVMVRPNRFALKFPLGLPGLYAIVREVFGAAHWSTASHMLSPIFAAAAILGAYALMRPIIGPFFALLGLLLLASSPVTIIYANTPNSHAVALCCVTWGMALMLKWQRHGGIFTAVVAGLFLGYAATVRYTEGLLIVPILIVALPKWRDDRAGSIAILSAWSAPILALFAFNLATLGHLSGYAFTHESTAFGLHYFARNAVIMAHSLDQLALQWMLPIALLGALTMFASARPLALVLWTWAGGTIAVYTAYYWSSQSGVTYLRFVLTALPALILAAMWFLQRVHASLGLRRHTVVAAGAITAISAGLNLLAATPLAEQNHWNDLQCRVMDQHLLAAAAQGSTIFTQRPNIPHLEVAGDWNFYLSNAFTPTWVHFLSQRMTDDDSPQILQPQRAEALHDMLKNESAADLIARQNQLIFDSVEAGRPVYALLPRRAMKEFVARFLPAAKFATHVVDQWEVDPRSRAAAPQVIVDSDGEEISASPDLGAPVVVQILKITPR